MLRPKSSRIFLKEVIKYSGLVTNLLLIRLANQILASLFSSVILVPTLIEISVSFPAFLVISSISSGSIQYCESVVSDLT